MDHNCPICGVSYDCCADAEECTKPEEYPCEQCLHEGHAVKDAE